MASTAQPTTRPTRRPIRRPTRRARRAVGALAAVAVGVLAAAGATAPATAAPKARIQVSGLGTTTVLSEGVTRFDGEQYAEPLPGPFAGVVRAMDGTMPALGECEPANAFLRVTESGGSRYFELAGTGEVCGLLLPLGTMHRFQGAFTVASTTEKKLARVTGVMDIRLLNGQADVYARG
jgi:hypothetical protein